MPTRILLSTRGAGDGAHEIDGPVTLGGSRADGIHVPGLPPAAIRVEPLPAGLVLQARAIGLRIAGRGVPPGSRRLLRPGERASFRGLSLELPLPPPDAPTRVAAAALLRGGAAALPAGPRLVVLSGPSAGEYVFAAAEIVIGRARTAALRVRDASASRRHARVRLQADRATVEDLGAKNPLKLNGVPVERHPVPLRGGDRMTIGETEVLYEDGSHVPESGGPLRRPPSRPGSPRRAPPLMAAALLATAATVLAVASACWG